MEAQNAVNYHPTCVQPSIAHADYAVLPVDYDPTPFDKVVDQLYMINGFHSVPLGESGKAYSRFRWLPNCLTLISPNKPAQPGLPNPTFPSVLILSSLNDIWMNGKHVSRRKSKGT